MSFPLAILRVVALLIPRAERKEWLTEWQSELWYIDRRRLRFCLGAFHDALWVRRNLSIPRSPQLLRLESPVHCLAFLALLAAISVSIALRPSPYLDSSNLFIVSPATAAERSSLTTRARESFTALAYYHSVQSANLTVAVASENLFTVLGIPIKPGLHLSRAAWRRHFGSDPHVVGRRLTVAGRQVLVASVIPDDSWRLLGRFDAWLLDDRQPQNSGFIVGRLGKSLPDWRWRLAVPNAHTFMGRPDFVLGTLAVIFIALLILPAVTSFSVGANRRWTFLAAKFALLLPTVFFGTLDLAPSLAPAGVQTHAMLISYVLAFRWILVDQRRRCPVCLRLLSHPTTIGRSSNTFLDWYGTEFLCAKGHGLLYVPEIPTSSSAPDRWLRLDPSWSSLFQPAGVPLRSR